jgi:hypothetical protein
MHETGMTEAIEYLRTDASCAGAVSDTISVQLAASTGAVIVEMPPVDEEALLDYVQRLVHLFLRAVPWEPSLQPPRVLALVVHEEDVLPIVHAAVAPFIVPGALHVCIDVPEGYTLCLPSGERHAHAQHGWSTARRIVQLALSLRSTGSGGNRWLYLHLYASPSLNQGWETSLALLVALVEQKAMRGFAGVAVGLAPTVNLHLERFPVHERPQRAMVFALLGMVCSDEHMRRVVTFARTWQRLETWGDDAVLLGGRRANVSLARLADGLRRIAVNWGMPPSPFDRGTFMMMTKDVNWGEFDICLRGAVARLALALPPV